MVIFVILSDTILISSDIIYFSSYFISARLFFKNALLKYT